MSESYGEWARRVLAVTTQDGCERALMPQSWADLEPWSFDLKDYA